MNLLVLVLSAHNIYVSTHVCIPWCVTLKNDIIEGNLLQKHFWFMCRSYRACPCFFVHVLSVWLFSQHGWGVRLCFAGAERSLQMEPCLPQALWTARNVHSNLHTDQIMTTPCCCFRHAPPSLDDTSSVHRQLTTKARWRQILVLDPLEWP